MFDFSIVTNWIHELLLSIMPEGVAVFIECVAIGVCIVALYAILAIILIYMERKVCGFFQCRLGPNRGGKTTITQAVGLAFLLAQNGIYVPATQMKFSPCDSIFTHFPADENDTVDLGRLGEESKRLAEIFSSASRYSLLLLNESLATTNVAEGLYIARDVVKSMRYLGTRAIFNTHMHDLARNLDEVNTTVKGDSKVESLVTGVENGQRSFKVFIAPPQGVSYAKDIAEKYGVTFDKI